MTPIARLTRPWRTMPIAVTATLVGLLLLIGFGVILQSEAAYRVQTRQQTRVQAEILAASVSAALDFGDHATAQEAADAMRANVQIRGVGIFDHNGIRVAGYRRDGAPPASTIAEARRIAGASPGIVGEAPVMSGGERVGTVRVSSDPQPFETRIGRYLLIGLLVIMAAIVIAILGVAQAALRRANAELKLRAMALAAANDELQIQMDERAKAEEQLRQAQKMQALGQLTGGIAHDFNNLLTVIQGSADMLTRSGIKEERRRRYADAIFQAASRAAELTGQLLAFARRQPLQPEAIDVNAMIGGMIDLLDRTLGERIVVKTALTPGICAVEADRAQLASAVLNVAVNARDAMPEGGTLTIATATGVDDTLQPMVAIAVTDTGSGMDAQTLERAMEPFFTTKSAGKGTGLGLSQVYGFATQSGGDLRILSAPGAGTTVTILLPCSSIEPKTEESRGAAPHARRNGSVLLVEDNEEVGEFAEALLVELGHEVTRARSGEEALALARDRRFDVVLSDVVMPAMTGLELAEQLETAYPGLPIVLTTGFSDEIAQSGAGGRPVILKPYRLESLAEALDQALAGAPG